jgi:hypothetical protein
MRKLFRVEIGVFVWALAFAVFFFGSLSLSINLDYRIVDVLLANPDSYSAYVQDALLYLILPAAIAFAFMIVALAKEVKSPTGVLEAFWLPITVFGFVFFLLSLLSLRTTYYYYQYNVSWIRSYASYTDIMPLIQTVYTTVMMGYVVWVLGGFLLMLSPIFKIILNRRADLPSPRA